MPSPILSRLLSCRSRGVASVLLRAVLLVAVAGRTASAEEHMYFPAHDNVTNVLVAKINAETVRVDISCWYLSEHAVSIALINKFKSGVPVRLIGDRGSIFEIDPPTRHEFYWLANQGLPIRLRVAPSWYPEIDHWKATIFVGQGEVAFGSANYSPFELAPVSSTNYKDETVLVTDDTVLFNSFKARFDQFWNDTTPESNSLQADPPYFKDWDDACATEPTGACDFNTQYPNPAPMVIDHARLEPDYDAPPDLIWGQGQQFNDRLVQEIDAENTSLQMVIYRLTVDNITNALLGRQQAGVPMQLMIEPNEYLNKKWPEFEITHANIDKLWAAGVPIKKRVHDGLTHMKVLVTSAYATNASSNYAAAWQRDHNYFISAIQKPSIYQAIKDRLTEMWNNANAFQPFYPLPPDAADQVQPSANATGVSTTPTFLWNRAAFATSYDVYLGTTQTNMTAVANVPAVVDNNPPDTYSWTVNVALLPSQNYFWQIVSRTNATPIDPAVVSHSPIRLFTTGSSGGGAGGGGTPFYGTPFAVPGTIEAEDFDNGGQGVAYQDDSAGNTGGAYRSTDVDIQAATEGGYNIGWTNTGEWVSYTVDVATAGNYTVRLRTASVGGGALHVGFNGPNTVWAPVSVPNTGGWQAWTTVNVPVTLGAGTQTLTLEFDSSGINITSLAVDATSGGSGGGPTPYAGSAAPIPGTVEAEYFDNGGEGVAYHDSTTGNAGGGLRSTDVDLEASTDGGYDVGWIGAGEWLKYTVSVASAGNYMAALRVASTSGGALHLLVDAPSNISVPVTVPNTGGWQNWTTVSVPVTLAAGTQVLTLQFDSSGFNVSAVAFTEGGGGGGTPPPDVVLYASDVPASAMHGAFTTVADPTSPGSVALTTPDNGYVQADEPLPTPTHYVDVTFDAQAATPYRIWLRLKAGANSKYNDAVWVQFSDARVSGSPIYPIGTTSALLVNLATNSSGASLNGWGWGNAAYWISQPTAVSFAASGPHTMRIQVREDGFSLDQIVLSPETYFTAAPGPPTDDATIVAKP